MDRSCADDKPKKLRATLCPQRTSEEPLAVPSSIGDLFKDNLVEARSSAMLVGSAR